MAKSLIAMTIAFVYWSLSTAVIAAENYYFWPTKVTQATPQEANALFFWPDYQALLQTTNGNSYAPAEINNTLADELSRIFKPEEGSALVVYRNELENTWGIAIPGGAVRRAENVTLLPLLEEHFVNCLSTLGQDDFLTITSGSICRYP